MHLGMDKKQFFAINVCLVFLLSTLQRQYIYCVDRYFLISDGKEKYGTFICRIKSVMLFVNPSHESQVQLFHDSVILAQELKIRLG